MIDTKDLRRMVNAAQFESFANSVINSLLDRLEAAEKERDALRIENEALRAEIIHIKEVEFPRKAQAVADGWRGKCERLEAKITEMERQEPVAKVRVHRTGGNAGLAWSVAPLNDFDSLPLMRDGDRLYALPGAKGE